jgi:hypothetical protein
VPFRPTSFDSGFCSERVEQMRAFALLLTDRATLTQQTLQLVVLFENDPLDEYLRYLVRYSPCVRARLGAVCMVALRRRQSQVD